MTSILVVILLSEGLYTEHQLAALVMQVFLGVWISGCVHKPQCCPVPRIASDSNCKLSKHSNPPFITSCPYFMSQHNSSGLLRTKYILPPFRPVKRSLKTSNWSQDIIQETFVADRLPDQHFWRTLNTNQDEARNHVHLAIYFRHSLCFVELSKLFPRVTAA